MSSPKQPHEIGRFQIERLILFSDAVFAIAITLLVIEIKVPHFNARPTNQELVNALSDQISEWIGFLVSFFVIGAFWSAHHRIFQYVDNQNDKLVFLNLVFLMTIVLMPFTSAFYSQYFGHQFPFRIYCLNIISTGVMQLFLWRYISHKKGIITHRVTQQARHYETARGSIVAVVFAISLLISYFSEWFESITLFWLSRTALVLIFIFIRLVNKRYKVDTTN